MKKTSVGIIILRIVAVVVAVAIIAVVASGLYVNSVISKITFSDKYVAASSEYITESVNGVYNVLVIAANDERDGINNKKSADIMMIVSFDVNTGSVKIANLNRTMGVQNDGTTEWISYAYNDGCNGIVKAIINNFKVAINGYLKFDISKMGEIIDAMSSIGENISVNIASEAEASEMNEEYAAAYNTPGNFVAGTNTLDSKNAVIYCMHISDLDVESRNERILSLMTSSIYQMKDKSLTSVLGFMSDSLSAFETSMTKTELLNFAWKGYSAASKLEIQSKSFPVAGSYTEKQETDAHYWLSVDYSKNATELDKFLYNK